MPLTGTRTGENFLNYISTENHFLLDRFVLFVHNTDMKMTKRTGKIKPATAATPPAPNKPKPSDGAQVIQLENPPPEYLLEEAMKEPDRKLLEETL